VKSLYVLAANLREFDEPSLGVVVGDRFNFVADSQWNKFNDKHELPSRGRMRTPVVLRLSLNGQRPEGEQRSDDRGAARERPPAEQPDRGILPGLPPIR
jgi:hypothetical protein